MAHSQTSSDKIGKTTKPSHNEVGSLKHVISSISTGIDVTSDEFYVELLNEDSDDSEIASVSDTTQSLRVIEKVTNDKLLEDTNCINENCSSESVKNLSLGTLEKECANVSSNSTPINTSIQWKITEEDLPMKIADQKVTEARQCHNSDSWTEDSSSSSSSDSDFFEEMHNSLSPKTIAIKSKGELDLEDLPPIEDLQISIEEKELLKVGNIHAIVTKQVVILALKDQKPLDLDSVLFLSHDKPLGRIFDVFGPVSEPFYIVRFNSPQDIINKGVTISADVYFAPQKSDITSFVFVDTLRLQKGSDASWKDNNEPPEEFLDYSDDEQEKIAKQKRRGKNRSLQDVDVQVISSKKSNNETKTVPKVDFTRNSVSNHKGKKFQPLGQSFQPHSSRNPFRRSFYSTSTGRKIAMSNKCSNNQSSVHTPALDEVPIWITSPPQFLHSTLSTSQANTSNNVAPVSIHYQAQSPLQHNLQQNQSPQLVSSYPPMQQIRPAQLMFVPKQPFIPRQPQNCDNQSMIGQTQFRFPVQERYINPPQPLIHQQVQQNFISQAPVMQNLNQPHTYRPAFSVASMTPVPSFPTQTFSLNSSNSVTSTPFIPTNYQTFAASPLPASGSNQPFQWQHQEQVGSPFTVQSPPPAVQFNTEVPSFPSLPPIIRFNAARNCPIPPPQPPQSPLSQQFLPNHSRF